MALIMYLNKAPRYKNIVTDQYESIPAKDIILVEKYFNWGMARDSGKYSCDTLEEWCGIPESELPHKYIVNYYGEHFTVKKTYSELAGENERHAIFEHLARIVKANQIFNWFVKNIMNNSMTMEYYEVSKEQLESLLQTCKKVLDGENVNENAAMELLPLMQEGGYFFGTNSYNEIYTSQVISVIGIVENILATTNFEKETIYFNAVW